MGKSLSVRCINHKGMLIGVENREVQTEEEIDRIINY